ncbi:MAG: O-antigen ligase family protein [Verrucomicrobia bacterium]|nr:O-antigen ligase family protein [Verrucomicrobiota bacterium]
MKSRRSYYYGQVVQGLEYNPRLFLYLLIFAVVVVYAYQFASQVSTQWMVAGFASLGILAGLTIMIWPYQAVMLYLGLAIWYHSFLRGETMVGMGSALVYPGDVFMAAFLVVEFFRGCMRQTHLYTATDRWMVALYAWALCCVARGVLDNGYSAIGESREFLHCISYFIVIHYVTRAEQTDSALRWLKWICIITAVCQLYFVVVVGGLKPRFAGGNLLNEYGCLNVVVLGILLGRDHIKRPSGSWSVILGCGTLLVVAGAFAAIYDPSLITSLTSLLGVVGNLSFSTQVLLLLPLGIGAAILLESAIQERSIAAIGIAMLLVLTFYSAMRAVVVSVLITLPFLLWITRRHFFKTMLLGAVAVTLGIVAVAAMNPFMGNQLDEFFAKTYRGIIDPSLDPTGSWRLYGWRWEIEKIFSNPFWVLIGQGFGGYYSWYFSLIDDVIKTGAHNQFIQFWSKMGLVGVGLFFTVVFSFYNQAFRFLQKSTDELQRSVMMIFMLVVLGNLVDMWVGQSMITLWPILAIGTALPRLWLAKPAGAPAINVTAPMRSRSPSGVSRRPPGQQPALSR